MLGKRVEVTWRDAAEPDDLKPWYTEEDMDKFGLEEDVIISSLGWVRSDTKLYLTIVADRTPNGDGTFTYGRPTKVPKGMILDIVELDSSPPSSV